jgi:hypothetical protein
LTGAIFVSGMVGLLPGSVVAAFEWLLPSIWGAIVVQFGLRNWRYAVVTVIASIVVVIYSGLPGWSHVPILVALMVALALFTHNRGIWVQKARKLTTLSAGTSARSPTTSSHDQGYSSHWLANQFCCETGNLPDGAATAPLLGQGGEAEARGHGGGGSNDCGKPNQRQDRSASHHPS